MEQCHPEEGFYSLEEHMQMYTDLFLLLQQEKGEQVRELFEEGHRRLERREWETEIFLPAKFLQESYHLTEFQYWVVMFAFCCELEEGLCLDYRNKFHGNRPTLQYIMHLLSQVLSVDFTDVAELCRKEGAMEDILELCPERDKGEEKSLLQCTVLLKPIVFCFLLTGGLPEEEWYGFFTAAEQDWEQNGQNFFQLHEREYGKLCRLLKTEEPMRIQLHGRKGSGKHTLMRSVCRKVHVDAVFVRAECLWKDTEEFRFHVRPILRLIVRLLNPVVILEFTEAVLDYSFREDMWKYRMEQLLTNDLKDSYLCFFTQSREQDNRINEYANVRFCLAEILSEEEKRLALDAWLKPEERMDWQEELFKKYRLNIGEMKSRQKTIRLQAQAGNVSLTDRTVWIAGLKEKQEVSNLGRLMEEQCLAEDMVLPKDCQKQLETVARLAKVWQKEKGLKLLFHGSPGTGKTMAASVLAGQLKLPLFKVDLSQMFDKYVGETEKHINEVFSLARRNQYLLFFDEADALFGKRTTVKDSHDKYANISASYLLSQVEEYEGILILATNLKDNFDDAFVRRIQFVIKFRNPDSEDRQRLWKKVLEGTPPVDDHVNFRALAEAAEWSPARICSAAYVARLLAVCDNSTTITAAHLLKAVMLEAEKDETAIKGF